MGFIDSGAVDDIFMICLDKQIKLSSKDKFTINKKKPRTEVFANWILIRMFLEIVAFQGNITLKVWGRLIFFACGAY